jgi:fatty-acyl-CoA synthase
MALPRPLHRPLSRLTDDVYFVAACARGGLLAPQPPVRLAKMAHGLLTRGSLAGLLNAVALRFAERTAVVDELGALTYADLDREANAIANGWLDRGLQPGAGVAILCRNHRYFLEAFFAATKCGARIVLLNTDFSGPQLRDVAAREGTDLLVHDDEHTELLAGVDPPYGRWRAWTERPGPDTLDALARASSTRTPPRPGVEARFTVLTSGTTGTPKGASRGAPKGGALAAVGGLLGRVPFHTGQTMQVCAPLFHSLGLATMLLGVTLGNTIVLRRRFDARGALEDLAEHHCDSMVAVPVMLQRMLELGPRPEDHPQLSVILAGGSQLGADLALRLLDAFGPVLHNFYGSTEVAYVSIATPAELATAPGTVGRPLRGAVVRVVDADGRRVDAGVTGRIVVGNGAQFEGYTGGGGKDLVDGLMATGDVGHLDEHGRLFVDGRDDEMIVSGGENVFPREVEELFEHHPAVREVAVVGVDDEQFGQRLRAFLVLEPGASLTEDDARSYVRDNLARYKTPREVLFLDELPRNPTGKIVKKDLPRD